MKTFLNLKDIIRIIITFIVIFIFTLILLMIFFPAENEKYGNGIIYTKDNKIYEISEDYKLRNTENFLQIDTETYIIRIPWDNISNWKQYKEIIYEN